MSTGQLLAVSLLSGVIAYLISFGEELSAFEMGLAILFTALAVVSGIAGTWRVIRGR